MPVHIGLAPAKLNLTLRVLGRGSDGFHDVATLMAPIDLFDVVRVRTAERSSCRCAGVEGENLAVRAAELLGVTARIEIDKRIPIAAGLAGGSSDAACVLRLMSGSGRHELASRLGSDVPFFLRGRPAWATGRGTDLEWVDDLPRFFAVLAIPPSRLRTGEMYDALGRGPTPAGPRLRPPALGGSLERLCEHVANDFLPAATERVPAISQTLDALRGAGARGVSISGKGPTCFGLFAQEPEAQAAAERLRAELPDSFLVIVTRSLGGRPGAKPLP